MVFKPFYYGWRVLTTLPAQDVVYCPIIFFQGLCTVLRGALTKTNTITRLSPKVTLSTDIELLPDLKSEKKNPLLPTLCLFLSV